MIDRNHPALISMYPINQSNLALEYEVMHSISKTSGEWYTLTRDERAMHVAYFVSNRVATAMRDYDYREDAKRK